MSKAEENYKYALKKDKYDPSITKSVDKKQISKKDANTVNKIQEMMQKEREKRGTRNIVTSENREEFMKKKLKLADEEEEVRVEDKPHGIYNKESGVIHSHYPNFAKARMTHESMGKRAEEHEIKELAEDERKERGYK
jgi:hypothetical protein